jgi:hypothetical protein
MSVDTFMEGFLAASRSPLLAEVIRVGRVAIRPPLHLSPKSRPRIGPKIPISRRRIRRIASKLNEQSP